METSDAKTFVLEPQGWLATYKPGQFITLVFVTRHGEKRRSYSISSSPALNEPLSITVKKVDNGEFSRQMLRDLKEGDMLHSSGIGGQFIPPETVLPQQHFCFLAAGSGIVPCYSQIKNLLATEQNHITLIYSNRSLEDTIFYNSLLELREKYAPRLEIRFLFSVNNDIYNKRLSKWLLEHLIAQYLEQVLHNTLFYLCGPFEYMQTIEITLRSKVPREHIIKENFSSLPRLVIPKPPDTEPHRVTIHLNGKTHVLEVQYPRSVLATAKIKGIDLPYSCEAGRCSSCIATCTQGHLWMAYNEVLSDREVEKGRVLVCQAYPIGGDAVISYDQET